MLDDILRTELVDKIQDSLDDTFQTAVKQICRATIETYIEAHGDEIADSLPVRASIYELIRKIVPNEIGNRLRCGAYDETLVRKVFNEHFDAEMQQAMLDQVRRAVREACKTEIERYLKAMLQSVTTNERSIIHQLEYEDRMEKNAQNSNP
jgi:hypothetical protein